MPNLTDAHIANQNHERAAGRLAYYVAGSLCSSIRTGDDFERTFALEYLRSCLRLVECSPDLTAIFAEVITRELPEFAPGLLTP